MDSDKELIEKARRRIKRQIQTGIKQHRVVQVSDRRFTYRVRTGQELLRFGVDSLNRVRLLVKK